jgi:hypothetical protein
MRARLHAGFRRFKSIPLLFFLFFIPWQASGWGPLGHWATGLIADSNLSPNARALVEKLLGGQSLAEVANWADSIRSGEDYSGSIWYHFEKIPDGVNYLDNLRALPPWQQQKGGLVAAILVANATLRDPAASPGEQADALKFLTHLVGDIHQPLHTGRPPDKGGLTIQATWFGKPMTLHRIWDSGLLTTGHADIAPPRMPLEQAGAAYAEELVRRFSGQPANAEMDVEAWLDESLALRPAAYETTYETDPEAYQARHLEEIDRQLYLAGVRLARMLNDIAAHEPVPARETELWNQIESVLGDPRRVIHLHR